MDQVKGQERKMHLVRTYNIPACILPLKTCKNPARQDFIHEKTEAARQSVLLFWVNNYSTETASLHRTRRYDNFTAKQNPHLTLIWTDICSSRYVESESNQFVLIFYLPLLQPTSIPQGTQYFSPQSHPAHKNLPFPSENAGINYPGC